MLTRVAMVVEAAEVARPTPDVLGWLRLALDDCVTLRQRRDAARQELDAAQAALDRALIRFGRLHRVTCQAQGQDQSQVRESEGGEA